MFCSVHTFITKMQITNLVCQYSRESQEQIVLYLEKDFRFTWVIGMNEKGRLHQSFTVFKKVAMQNITIDFKD